MARDARDARDEGRERLYYTDPSGYVSELVKHGY